MVPSTFETWVSATTRVRPFSSSRSRARSSSPPSVTGRCRRIRPSRRASLIQGTRLAWCSISVTRISSPGRERRRQPAGHQVQGRGGAAGDDHAFGRARPGSGPRARGSLRTDRWPRRPGCACRGGRWRCARGSSGPRRRSPLRASGPWRRCPGRPAGGRSRCRFSSGKRSAKIGPHCEQSRGLAVAGLRRRPALAGNPRGVMPIPPGCGPDAAPTNASTVRRAASSGSSASVFSRKPLTTRRTASPGSRPRLSQVEQLLLVHRRDGGAVAAADFLVEDLQFGDGVGPAALRQQQVAVLLVGLAVAGVFLDADQAGVAAAGLSGGHGLEVDVAGGAAARWRWRVWRSKRCFPVARATPTISLCAPSPASSVISSILRVSPPKVPKTVSRSASRPPRLAPSGDRCVPGRPELHQHVAHAGRPSSARISVRPTTRVPAPPPRCSSTRMASAPRPTSKRSLRQRSAGPPA